MTDSIRIAEYPDMLKAIGDTDQMMVFRSPVVRQSDSIMLPVLEHIERHGLVLADETTIDDAMMMGGKAVLSWYMTRDNMRDGLLGFDGPGALQRLWARRDEAPASPGTGGRAHLKPYRSVHRQRRRPYPPVGPQGSAVDGHR